MPGNASQVQCRRVVLPGTAERILVCHEEDLSLLLQGDEMPVHIASGEGAQAIPEILEKNSIRSLFPHDHPAQSEDFFFLRIEARGFSFGRRSWRRRGGRGRFRLFSGRSHKLRQGERSLVDAELKLGEQRLGQEGAFSGDATSSGIQDGKGEMFRKPVPGTVGEIDVLGPADFFYADKLHLQQGAPIQGAHLGAGFAEGHSVPQKEKPVKKKNLFWLERKIHISSLLGAG